MINPWTMKMEQFTRFKPEERARLDALITRRQARHSPREDIISEGGHSDHCHVLVSGLAMRYKILEDGSRQIMAFLVPGDLCDAEIFILKTMDHTVGAVAETTTAMIHADDMKELLREVSCMSEALWWGTLTDLAVLRERIVDHGRRGALQRLAHLFYEMLVRYRVIGEAQDDSFDFPITQDELADATGLTPVHVNRMLQKLRGDGLIELRGRKLSVLDPAGLAELARFNADYLHLHRAHDARGGIEDRVGDLV